MRAELEEERRAAGERAARMEKKMEAGRAALEEEQLKHIREVRGHYYYYYSRTTMTTTTTTTTRGHKLCSDLVLFG